MTPHVVAVRSRRPMQPAARRGLYFRAAPERSAGPVLLTVPEACAVLRISRWTLYELVRRRRLRTVRIGSRRLVPVTAIDELIHTLAADEERP